MPKLRGKERLIIYRAKGIILFKKSISLLTFLLSDPIKQINKQILPCANREKPYCTIWIREWKSVKKSKPIIITTNLYFVVCYIHLL